MSAIVYSSAAIYIQSAANKVERLNRIDAIITALFDAALVAATDDGVSDYFLNDGQVQIKSSVRTPEQIYKSIAAFERLKQVYLNQLNSRVVRLIDSKNLIGRNGNGRL